MTSSYLDISYQLKFKELLNNNLCENKDLYLIIPFCNIKNISYKFEPEDNYKLIIERGIQGFISSLDLLVNTDFDYELSKNKYLYDFNAT